MMGKVLGLLSKFAMLFLKNPVNSILAFAFLFYVCKVYLFDGSMLDKLIMYGVIVLWGIWFLLRHIFVLLVIIVVAGAGGYIYYTHNQKLKTQCEQSGGVWNSNTRVCEEKVSIKDKVQKFLSDFMKDEKPTQKQDKK